jgi:4'-phosphopantetheinyl transferase EntD
MNIEDSYGATRSLLVPNLFDREVSSFEVRGPAPDAPLFGLESASIVAASEKRRLEYAAGRLCARLALAELGVHDFPLLSGEKREPLWPDGFFGSITHTKGYCAAVVAPSRVFLGLGIDCEAIGRVSVEMERLICTPEERGWLGHLNMSERRFAATVLFSAKEAFYKCQFCVTHSWLGFREVEFRLEGDGFVLELVEPEKFPLLTSNRFTGRFRSDEGYVYTGVSIPVGD